ncbi:MAG: hypothetical protein RBR23_00640 [Arcobacteraceae bacterium]|jgi:hypothetical protein|nr:hypothetical protein [Arcobacteraceae bacterium]
MQITNIQRNILSSENISLESSVQEYSKKSFDKLITDETNFNLQESNLRTLDFQELKEIKLELEKSNKLYSLGLDFNASSLLEATTLTNDVNFNKSLVETMQTKESPFFYLMETKHNMEYSEGRREYPWPTLSVEEAQGNYSPLTNEEIKNINIAKFLETIISAYEELLSNLPHYYDREETKQSLEDLKEIKQNYQKLQDEQNSLLDSFIKNNRPNPLESFHNNTKI